MKRSGREARREIDCPPGRLVIFQVVESLAIGGAESLAVEIANRLKPPLYESHVVCTHGTGPLAERLAPHVRLFCLHRTSRANLSSFRRFAHYASKSGVDIVHSHGHFTAYFCGLARMLTGGSWLHLFHDHNVLPGQALLLSLGDRIFLRNLDAYVVVNERLLGRALRLRLTKPGRCYYVPNGVVLRTQHATTRAVTENANPREEPIVLQLANLREVKDQLTAVRAAALLGEMWPSFRWWFVGSIDSDPSYAQRVQQEIRRLGLEQRAILVGQHPDPSRLLQYASVGVLSSRTEGLPLALLEYMQAGLPVVVTDAGYCGKLVKEAGAGFVVSPGDPETLAEKIAWLLAHPEKAIEMGERGRALIRSRYTIDHTVDAVSRIYRSLVDR